MIHPKKSEGNTKTKTSVPDITEVQDSSKKITKKGP